MIIIYCRAKHRSNRGLCPECDELLNYASYRVEKCPHKEEKPSCAKCEIHCYSEKMREQIKIVMRYSGPRMLILHPILSIYHYLDSRKPGSLKRSRSLPVIR